MRVLSHTFNCDWGEEYHSLHRPVDIKGARHPQENSQMKETGMLIVSINILCMLNYLFLFVDILLLSVWISDETLPLVFDILLLGDWISDESLRLVFDVLLLSVWIPDESLRLVFDILLIVFGCQMKHSFLCLIYYFSVFGYQMKHSFSCLIYHMKHSSCLIYKCI